MTTRRPRIGLVDGQYAAVEVLDDSDALVWYSDSIDGNYEWLPSADFTPLAEVPEPRMDEPQETWATVVARYPGWTTLRVFYRRPGGKWERLDTMGCNSGCAFPWSALIDPRPSTPAERATGIVGGEDQ